MRLTRPRLAAVAAVTLASLALGPLPAAQAAGTDAPARAAAAVAVAETAPLDRAGLRAALDAFHEAGMYGAHTAVRDGHARWRGATGYADVDTKQPMRADMEHRIGSITKTFTAVALLQQSARGRLDLDAPVGRYLPELVPGERGRQVTVRMLLNHTSGIGDYVLPAFPGIVEDPGKALDAQRFRHIEPEELARLGLAAPATTVGKHVYSNTNYVLAGLVLEKVTGQDAEAYITRNVIRRAGLKHTYFPASPRLTGPHPKMYESFYGYIEPARDYSVYDMSWAGAAGAMVSTPSDLASFYRQLLGGRLLGPAELKQMKTTVPAYDAAPGEEVSMRYGLGLYTLKMPSGGWYWGHDGAVFGAGTWALSTEDGSRQTALAYNLMKYQRFEENGTPKPDPVTPAMVAYMDRALSGGAPEKAARKSAEAAKAPFAPGLVTEDRLNLRAATVR
ncbi:serine hydrolase domain-containing protein [Streptomyces sp. HUAS MG47]|uniref:serine hydrolase domain-containing protein n=1 Tax=Streptomyces solicamelliae TaxID=3231716 RepID=UPI0038781371